MEINIKLKDDEQLARNVINIVRVIDRSSLPKDIVNTCMDLILKHVEEHGFGLMVQDISNFIAYAFKKIPRNFYVRLMKLSIELKDPRSINEIYLSAMKHHGIMDDNNLNETFLKMMIKMKCAPKSILTENADVVKDFMGIYGPAVAVRGLSSYEDPAVSMLFRHLFDDSNTQGIKLMKIDTAEFLLRNIFYNMNWINSLAHGWKISNVTGIIDGKGKRNTEDRKYLCSIIRETILDSATITLNAVVKKYYENIDKPTSTNTGQRTINATFKKVLEEIFNDEFFEDTRAKKAKMANRLKK